jgi:hypothetical protein
MNFLDGFSEHRVRGALIEGIEALRKTTPGRLTFEYSDLVGQVARLLLPGRSTDAFKAWQHNQAEFKRDPNPNVMAEQPDNRKLLGALWSLVADGILFPRLTAYSRDGHPHLLQNVTLTERGERLVIGGDEHPLHAGFLSRFRANAPTATDAVVAHMEDAVTCLEAQVFRPALMMLGVANEETIRIAHAALAHQGKLAPAAAMTKARDLLDDIETVLRAWATAAKNLKDERHRLVFAAGSIETIRVERNAAAHPGKKALDGPNIEALLTLASHHLPVFWELLVKPAVAVGFALP